MRIFKPKKDDCKSKCTLTVDKRRIGGRFCALKEDRDFAIQTIANAFPINVLSRKCHNFPVFKLKWLDFRGRIRPTF